jgi:hypothetical protein
MALTDKQRRFVEILGSAVLGYSRSLPVRFEEGIALERPNGPFVAFPLARAEYGSYRRTFIDVRVFRVLAVFVPQR